MILTVYFYDNPEEARNLRDTVVQAVETIGKDGSRVNIRSERLEQQDSKIVSINVPLMRIENPIFFCLRPENDKDVEWLDQFGNEVYQTVLEYHAGNSSPVMEITHK